MTSAGMGHRMGDFGMHQAIAPQIQVRSLDVWQPELLSFHQSQCNAYSHCEVDNSHDFGPKRGDF